MTKQSVIQKIIAELERDLELYAKTARDAHAEATHEQSKAENKYDTRGLEASYLARGQSKQAAQMERAREQFAALESKQFGPEAPADLGALIELEDARGIRSCYFIGPSAGGTEVCEDGVPVLVLTPQSPLGQQLVGRKRGERFTFTIGREREEYRVGDIS